MFGRTCIIRERRVHSAQSVAQQTCLQSMPRRFSPFEASREPSTVIHFAFSSACMLPCTPGHEPRWWAVRLPTYRRGLRCGCVGFLQMDHALNKKSRHNGGKRLSESPRALQMRRRSHADTWCYMFFWDGSERPLSRGRPGLCGRT